MPNIEMYGFDNGQATGIDSMIQNLFVSKSYKNDYVTTFIESHVTDYHNQKQPFLRLATTRNEYTEDVLKELEKLKFDIEVMILDRFIPKIIPKK